MVKSALSRRGLLKGMAAGALVLGFDPVGRTWLTSAHAHGRGHGHGRGRDGIHIPSLDGTLLIDQASLTEAADDFGHIIHRTPIAVLRPGSVRDIQKMVQYANRHGLRVAARGQGHTTFGQAQVDGGVVIDMRGFDTIHSVSPAGARVDAGVLWSTLFQTALQHGLTPPVATDYIELSVGGTLSVGGIGGMTHQHGLQIDNVLELEVVTGRGQKVRCSRHHRRDLFDAVLGGLGQCGIIVRATVRLVPAKSHARVYNLFYSDLSTFTADQRRLIAEERFDYVEGQALVQEDGSWLYLLEAARYYTPPAAPDDAALLADLQFAPGHQVEDVPYFDFINRLAPLMALLQATGAWELPHPWVNVFVPSSEADVYLASALSGLTPDNTGNGPILLYPFKTSRLHRPFFAVPDEPVAFMLSVLRFAPPVPALVQEMLDHNRALYEDARDRGGKQYPIGSIPFGPQDWRDHFGDAWSDFRRAKRRYDPRDVLTPGPGIF